jgi:hypothetical protein
VTPSLHLQEDVTLVSMKTKFVEVLELDCIAANVRKALLSSLSFLRIWTENSCELASSGVTDVSCSEYESDAPDICLIPVCKEAECCWLALPPLHSLAKETYPRFEPNENGNGEVK